MSITLLYLDDIMRRDGSRIHIISHKDNGDYYIGVHLFPSRTEKLSPIVPMVLQSNVGE